MIRQFANHEYLEVILNDGSIRKVTPNASFSLLDSGKDEPEAVDRLATLSKYHGPKYIELFELEIMNDAAIYQSPLEDVLTSFSFFKYTKKNFESWGEK